MLCPECKFIREENFFKKKFALIIFWTIFAVY